MNRKTALLKQFIILIFVLFSVSPLFSAIPASERAALIAFYNATNGDGWSDNYGWKGNNNEADGFSQIGSEGFWKGITVTTVNGGDHVTTISLCCNQLSGTIPSDVGDITHLQNLTLHSNNLTGAIPPELGNLFKLETLYISSNKLSGPFPKELCNLVLLKKLWMDDNEVGGNFPYQIGNLTNIEQINISHNQIGGTFPWEIGFCTKLFELNLSGNRMGGYIPKEIENLTELVSLIVGGNYIAGIAPEIGKLTKIKVLDVSHNRLYYQLPTELGNLVNLIELHANNNSIYDEIPDEWKNLTKLSTFDMSHNNLYGNIPSYLGDLPQLLILHLNNNELTGEIPANLGVHGLQRVHLQHNKLSGSIPPALAGGVIDELNLSYNNFSGLIPPEIGDGGTTMTINLSNNNLGGPIPPDFSRLAIVEVIDLSHNKLDGPIPEELGDIFWIYKLHLQGNMLSGQIPTSFSKFTSISELNIAYNALYSKDAGLNAYLDSVCSGWSATQTSPPTNLQGEKLSASSVKLSWTAVEFSTGTGGYKIYSKTVKTEPWNQIAAVPSKSFSQYTIDDLTPGQLYYFALRTWSGPHPENINTLLSGLSDQIYIYMGDSQNMIVVDPRRLDFHYIPGQPWQPKQIMTLMPTGVNCSFQSTTNWCSVLPEHSNGGEIEVQVNTTGLTPGMYNGTIKISSANGLNSPVEVPVQLVIEDDNPGTITLNRDHLIFGAISGESPQPVQTFSLDADRPGSLVWSASSDQSWISFTPDSGTGASNVQVTVNTNGLSVGEYSGSIIISAPGAANSPEIEVILTVKSPQDDQLPFGSFDSPGHDVIVQGSIPVTGWALDDTGVDHVKIYRSPIKGETGSKIYIGDAVFVEGARPDVEQAYPDFPFNYRAGWGYMLLTNKLPGIEGNSDGPFTLYSVITDQNGNQTTMGPKTIVVNNADSVLPFGTIDTPSQGGTISGSAYVNFGWVLTPQPNTIPFDGSTIGVWIDGVFKGHPVYNRYRQDIAAIFPGYNNSNGAVGYFYVDTTAYANGVHTIAWSVEDDAGNKSGIGSRYFTIQNTGKDSSNSTSLLCQNINMANPPTPVDSPHNIYFRSGFDHRQPLKALAPEKDGTFTIQSRQLKALEIRLPSSAGSIINYSPLPIGAVLDPTNSIIYWLPGPGFLGEFDLIFTTRSLTGNINDHHIKIIIK